MTVPFTTKTIKAVINDHEILLDFYRGWERHHRIGKYRRTTHCTIFIDGVNGPSGIAYFNPADRVFGFDEEFGRELAFKRAVSDLDKYYRRLAWQTLLLNRGILKMQEEQASAA